MHEQGTAVMNPTADAAGWGTDEAPVAPPRQHRVSLLRDRSTVSSADFEPLSPLSQVSIVREGGRLRFFGPMTYSVFDAYDLIFRAEQKTGFLIGSMLFTIFDADSKPVLKCKNVSRFLTLRVEVLATQTQEVLGFIERKSTLNGINLNIFDANHQRIFKIKLVPRFLAAPDVMICRPATNETVARIAFEDRAFLKFSVAFNDQLQAEDKALILTALFILTCLWKKS